MATDLTLLINLEARDLASGAIKALKNSLEEFGAMGDVALGLVAGFTAVGVALEAAVTSAAHFQTTMNQVQQNTGANAAQTAAMSAEVLKFSDTFGVSTDKIAEGYAHVLNITHDAAAAQGIMNVSLQSSVATGADAAQVANVLTNAMHEYGLDTSTAATEAQRLADVNANAAHVMGIMHIAAQDANMTLEQFSSTTGQAIGIAAGMKIPLEDIAAADASLTKHGFDAARAGTQVTDMLTHLIKPSAAASDELARLSKITGVDLVSDLAKLTSGGMGLVGFLDELHKAYQIAGLSEAEFATETFKLVAAQRGGLGMNALLTTGYEDLHKILGDVSDQVRVNTVTEQGWIDTQKTAGEQWNILTQSISNAGIELGTRFLPILTPVLAALSADIPIALKATGDAFNAAADATRPFRDAIADLWSHALIEFGELKSAVQLLFNGYFPEALDQASRAIATFGGYLIDHLARWAVSFETWVLDAIPGLMQNLGDLLGKVGEWISGKGASDIQSRLPAWITAFTGWASEVYGPLVTKLNDMLGQLGGWITGYAAPFLWDKVQEWSTAFIGWIGPMIPPMLTEAGKLLVSLGGWIKDTALPAIIEQLAKWGVAFVQWVLDVTPKVLSATADLGGQLLRWVGDQVPGIAFALGAWAGAFTTWIGNAALALPGELGKLLTAITSWVTGDGATGALKAGNDLASSIVDGFTKFFTSAIPTLVSNIGNLVPAAIQAMTTAMSSFGAGWQSTANGGPANPATFQSSGMPPLNPATPFGSPLAGGGTGTGGATGGAIVDIIREAAIRHGIDPDIAIRVAMSEGGTTEGARVGDSGSSFGPFQLHYGNIAAGGNAVSGLGDTFTKQTGLDARDPANVAAAVDFAIAQAAQSGWGAWHGAPLAGVTPWMGIHTAAGSGVGMHDIVPGGQPTLQADGTYQFAPGGANYQGPAAGAAAGADIGSAAGVKAVEGITDKWDKLMQETAAGLAKIDVRENKQFADAEKKLGPAGTDVQNATTAAADKVADLDRQKAVSDDIARRKNAMADEIANDNLLQAHKVAGEELVYNRKQQDDATAHARQIEDANIVVNQQLANVALVHTRTLADAQTVHQNELALEATQHQRVLQDQQELVNEQLANVQLVHQRSLQDAQVPVTEQLATQATVHSRTLEDTETQYQFQLSLSKATTDAQRQQIEQAHQDELTAIAHRRQLQDAENIYQQGLQAAAVVAQRALQDAEIKYQDDQKAQQLVRSRASADAESVYQMGLRATETVYQRGLQDQEITYQQGIAAEALKRQRTAQDAERDYSRGQEDIAIQHKYALEAAAIEFARGEKAKMDALDATLANEALARQKQQVADELKARIAAIAVEYEAKKQSILDEAAASREAFKLTQDQKAKDQIAAAIEALAKYGAAGTPIVAKMQSDWLAMQGTFATATADIDGNLHLQTVATQDLATASGKSAQEISAAYGITDLAVETYADLNKISWDDARLQMNAAAANAAAVLGTGGLIPSAFNVTDRMLDEAASKAKAVLGDGGVLPTATKQAGAAFIDTGKVSDTVIRPALDQLQDAAKKLASDGMNRAKDATTQISFVLQQLNDKMPSLISQTHSFANELNAIPHNVDIQIATHYTFTGTPGGGGGGGSSSGDGGGDGKPDTAHPGESGPGGIWNDPTTGQPYTHARGGVTTGPVRGIFGEAGPEAIIPLGEYFVSHKSDAGAVPPIDYDKLAAAMVRALQNVSLNVGVDQIHTGLLQKARRGPLGLT